MHEPYPLPATLYPLAEQVWGCSHVRLLWDAARGGAVVQAGLLMDP